MTGTPATAPDGAEFYDLDAPVTHILTALKDTGIQGVARYLSRVHGQTKGDLSIAEVAAIHAAGLAVVPVQHVAAAGWVPDAVRGQSTGVNAAANAASIGCPTGVGVWLDLEGVAASSPASDVIAYCQAWYRAVLAAKYVPDIYVGANPGIDSSDLYYKLSFKNYWHSGSASAPIPVVRGCQIVQRIVPGRSISGIQYDSNVVQRDELGDLPTWWTKA